MLVVLVVLVDVVLVRVAPTWVSSSDDSDDKASPSAELLEVVGDLSGLPSSAISVAVVVDEHTVVADVDLGHVRLVVAVHLVVALRLASCEEFELLVDPKSETPAAGEKHERPSSSSSCELP